MNLELVFALGVLWGERYQKLYDMTGLNDSMGLSYEDLHTAAKGGAGILGEATKNKALIFEKMAFANVKTEILHELFLHVAQKQDLLNLIKSEPIKETQNKKPDH